MTKASRVVVPALLVLLSCTPNTVDEPAPSPEATAAAAEDAVPSALATPGDAAPIPNEERQQPLTRLGPCGDPPGAGDHAPVSGLVLPEEAIVTQVAQADPLTNVQGYITMTPVQIRAYYQQHADTTVISVEDEVFESELLFESADRRVFLKSQAVCELGSVFVAVVSPAAP